MTLSNFSLMVFGAICLDVVKIQSHNKPCSIPPKASVILAEQEWQRGSACRCCLADLYPVAVVLFVYLRQRKGYVLGRTLSQSDLCCAIVMISLLHSERYIAP